MDGAHQSRSGFLVPQIGHIRPDLFARAKVMDAHNWQKLSTGPCASILESLARSAPSTRPPQGTKYQSRDTEKQSTPSPILMLDMFRPKFEKSFLAKERGPLPTFAVCLGADAQMTYTKLLACGPRSFKKAESQMHQTVFLTKPLGREPIWGMSG